MDVDVYGSECWVMKEIDERLYVAKMQMLRWLRRGMSIFNEALKIAPVIGLYYIYKPYK